MKSIEIAAAGLMSLFVMNAFASDPGISDKEIVIGAHTLESGALGAFSQISSAAAAYYDMVNEKGGVDGRKIKFIRVDSHSDFSKVSEGVRKLVEQDKVFAVVGGVGNFHEAAYKYLIEKNIPDMFTNDGAGFYTDPPNKVVFPFSWSYPQEGVALANHAIKHLAGKKFCFLPTETVPGKEMPKAMIEVFEKYNKTAADKDKIIIGASESVNFAVSQADSQVARLKKENCDAVMSTGVPVLSAAEMNYGFRHDFKPKWYLYRHSATDKLLALLDPAMSKEGIVTVSPVAINDSFGVPGWDDFKKLMEKNNIPVSGISAQGYYQAELFVETLRQAATTQGHDLTREKYIKAVENFKDWKCSICFQPSKISATNHWPLTPTLLVADKSSHWTIDK